jgi:hypothetical protein
MLGQHAELVEPGAVEARQATNISGSQLPSAIDPPMVASIKTT